MTDITTIRVHKETKNKLEELKIHPREPYEEVLERLIESAGEGEGQATREKALNDFVRRMKERDEGEIEEITLYGSYARGEEEEESDIDVLIIWSGDLARGRKIAAEVETEVLIDHGVLISPKLVSPENYERMKKKGLAFAEKVGDEGVKIA